MSPLRVEHLENDDMLRVVGSCSIVSEGSAHTSIGSLLLHGYPDKPGGNVTVGLNTVCWAGEKDKQGIEVIGQFVFGLGDEIIFYLPDDGAYVRVQGTNP